MVIATAVGATGGGVSIATLDGATLNGPGVLCGARDGCMKNLLHRDAWVVEEGPSTTIGTSATDDSRPLRKRFMLVCVCVHTSIYLRTAREAIRY